MINKSEFDYIKTFPPLGHPEHHFNKHPNHHWLKNKDDIKNWLRSEDRNYMDNKKYYNIHEDLTVSLELADLLELTGFKLRKIDLCNKFLNHIPVQFKECWSFKVNNSKLTSLIGTPYVCKVLSSFNNRITNFKGLSKNVGFLDVYNNPIVSWDGFCGSVQLMWWQEEWCNKSSYKLLISTPESVEKIEVSKSFSEKCKFFFNTISLIINEEINMEELRVVQQRIKKTKKTEMEIEGALKIEINYKKRKL